MSPTQYFNILWISYIIVCFFRVWAFMMGKTIANQFWHCGALRFVFRNLLKLSWAVWRTSANICQAVLTWETSYTCVSIILLHRCKYHQPYLQQNPLTSAESSASDMQRKYCWHFLTLTSHCFRNLLKLFEASIQGFSKHIKPLWLAI